MKLIAITGRLTADPETKILGDKHVKRTRFRLANNDSEKDTGEFYDVTCWNLKADFAQSHLKKGEKVLIQGTFSNQAYTDDDGNHRVHFTITANRMEYA